MAMYALISGERICELRADIFDVAPAFQWVEAPEGATMQHRYVDGAFVAPIEPPATGANVNAERDRRIIAGTIFDVTGYGASVWLTGRLQDRIVYQQRMAEAQRMIADGDTTSTLVLRDGDDVNRHLTAPQMMELIGKAVAWVEAVMQVSWDMKDGNGNFPDGIPADFATNESYWP